MSIKEVLDLCVKRSELMTKQIALSHFGDDSPESRIITRRFSVAETAELVGVSPPTIRAAEASGELPPPDIEKAGSVNRRVGYTIYQIDRMREYFGTRPIRPPHAKPVVISFAVNKGGAWKTSSAVHNAQSYAIAGYRTLLIDMDPQATASLYHGYVPDIHVSDKDTLLPFFLGEEENAAYAIKSTCWPQLDIIPSCLSLQRIESEVYKLQDEGKLNFDIQNLLRAAIESIYDNYDIIVIDGAPSLGVGTINIVCASDIIIVPTPAELYDYVSSAQFFTMLRDVMTSIDLDGFEPIVKVLVTKYSNDVGKKSKWMLQQIRSAWGDMILNNVVKTTEEVGKGQIKMRTVYEQASNQRGTIKAWRNALSIWEPVAHEILTDLILPQWGVTQ